MASRVVVRVPATTANLGPGFDCLGMALDLENEIRVEVGEGEGLHIHVGGSQAGTGIPTDERNLVFRSMMQAFEAVGESGPTAVRMELDIEAPLARGLGSSASAIVGGMMAAQGLMDGRMSSDALLREMVEAEGHPDNVVACYAGGLTASLRGADRVHVARSIPHEDLRCVLTIPGYKLSTAEARKAIPASITVKDAVANMARVPLLLRALEAGDWDALRELTEDRLHQPYRKSLIRHYDAIMDCAFENGAAGAWLSGAGPTLCAVVSAERGDALRAALARLTSGYEDPHSVLLVRPSESGARVVDAS